MNTPTAKTKTFILGSVGVLLLTISVLIWATAVAQVDAQADHCATAVAQADALLEVHGEHLHHLRTSSAARAEKDLGSLLLAADGISETETQLISATADYREARKACIDG